VGGGVTTADSVADAVAVALLGGAVALLGGAVALLGGVVAPLGGVAVALLGGVVAPLGGVEVPEAGGVTTGGDHTVTTDVVGGTPAGGAPDEETVAVPEVVGGTAAGVPDEITVIDDVDVPEVAGGTATGVPDETTVIVVPEVDGGTATGVPDEITVIVGGVEPVAAAVAVEGTVVVVDALTDVPTDEPDADVVGNAAPVDNATAATFGVAPGEHADRSPSEHACRFDAAAPRASPRPASTAPRSAHARAWPARQDVRSSGSPAATLPSATRICPSRPHASALRPPSHAVE